jgi:hypothetical protein
VDPCSCERLLSGILDDNDRVLVTTNELHNNGAVVANIAIKQPKILVMEVDLPIVVITRGVFSSDDIETICCCCCSNSSFLLLSLMSTLAFPDNISSSVDTQAVK